MVGKGSPKRSYSLERVLTEKHIGHILKQVIIDTSTEYEVICSEARPAADGLCGYLGDHMRVVLHVTVKDGVQKVNLFVKRLPVGNKPKADFIRQNKYFNREMLMLQLLDELNGAEGPNPFCAKAYIYTESLVVMPDLAVAGYSVHPLMETMDLRHVLLTVSSLARYHAAFANYETNKRKADPPYKFYKEHRLLLEEPTFSDTPWVRTGAKLTADLLDTFSTKYTKKYIPDLEAKLAKLYIEACDNLDVAEGSLNVIVHKDLWNNNILFKYVEGVPTNAVLIDYQCVRYAPPTFDLMSFLHLTTSKAFREEHENRVLNCYFQAFLELLDETTREHLDVIGYDEKEFLSWCEKSRMFGIFETVALYPQVLMDGKTAQKVFDDPDTFMTIAEQDRSEPLLEYARTCPVYRARQLEVAEEFVERYVLGQP